MLVTAAYNISIAPTARPACPPPTAVGRGHCLSRSNDGVGSVSGRPQSGCGFDAVLLGIARRRTTGRFRPAAAAAAAAAADDSGRGQHTRHSHESQHPPHPTPPQPPARFSPWCHTPAEQRSPPPLHTIRVTQLVLNNSRPDTTQPPHPPCAPPENGVDDALVHLSRCLLPGQLAVPEGSG